MKKSVKKNEKVFLKFNKNLSHFSWILKFFPVVNVSIFVLNKTF